MRIRVGRAIVIDKSGKEMYRIIILYDTRTRTKIELSVEEARKLVDVIKEMLR